MDKSVIENGAYVATNLVVNYLKNVEELDTETDDRCTPKSIDNQSPSSG